MLLMMYREHKKLVEQASEVEDRLKQLLLDTEDRERKLTAAEEVRWVQLCFTTLAAFWRTTQALGISFAHGSMLMTRHSVK